MRLGCLRNWEDSPLKDWHVVRGDSQGLTTSKLYISCSSSLSWKKEPRRTRDMMTTRHLQRQPCTVRGAGAALRRQAGVGLELSGSASSPPLLESPEAFLPC